LQIYSALNYELKEKDRVGGEAKPVIQMIL